MFIHSLQTFQAGRGGDLGGRPPTIWGGGTAHALVSPNI